jgi:outer membrane protein TolC
MRGMDNTILGKDYKRSVWILALLSLVTGASAQTEARYLRMDEAIREATVQNRSVQVAKTEEQIAVAGYRQTKAIFLPQLTASYTAMSTNNPLNAFGFKLQQQRLEASDFDPGRLNNPDAASNFMAKVSVRQPLFNLDMIHMRRAASRQTEAQRLKLSRTKEFVSWQVQQAYLQLSLAWEMKQVMQDALATALSARNYVKDRFDLGMVQQSDLLNAEVHLKAAETRLSEAKSNIENASDYLNLLMNKPTGITYRPDTVIVAGNELQDIATPSSRADMLAMEAGIAAYDQMVAAGNAVADYQLHDDRAFGFYGNGYLAGVQLSWDLFKPDLHQKNRATVLERDKLRLQLEDLKENAQSEIKKTNRQIKDASFKISQQREAVKQAEEALRITRNRYEQGLVSTTDLLSAQTQHSLQRLALAEAIFGYNSASYYLRFLTTQPH